jgi:predicted membrane protein
MKLKAQVIFGAIIIIIGLAELLANVLDVNAGTVCFPTLLILIGLWILFGSRLLGLDAALKLRVFGAIRRKGAWVAHDEETLLFLGDVIFDMSEAEIPEGETHLGCYGFLGSVYLRVPDGVGVSVSSKQIMSDVRLFGERASGFLVPVDRRSEGYDQAARRVHLETMYFLGSVRVKRTQPAAGSTEPTPTEMQNDSSA